MNMRIESEESEVDETLCRLRRSRGSRGLLRGIIVSLTAALVLLTPTASAGLGDLQHVTLIGDSVADAIPGSSSAVATLRQGIDLDLEVAACRRVDQDSCPIGGTRPQNVVQLVNAMEKRLGPNVVVAVGYNDYENQYARNIENALHALKAAGVVHVYWLTLHVGHRGYVNMNSDILAAAAGHPELSVIDWNAYSRTHDDWFQPDGLHLLGPGSEAMATLIHQRLLNDGIAVKPVRLSTSALPVARRGKPYTATLSAADGMEPYRWSLLARAPKGLHLYASGAIIGKPSVKPGRYVLNTQVKDALGSLDTRRLTLRVMP